MTPTGVVLTLLAGFQVGSLLWLLLSVFYPALEINQRFGLSLVAGITVNAILVALKTK